MAHGLLALCLAAYYGSWPIAYGLVALCLAAYYGSWPIANGSLHPK
jgi:hypothetical protein